ncbi:nuclear RNA-binding protein sart-3-like [Topomyia yanbarensis]|uniref:nuclear RNA-binding protein sart-3-like n=1 Tax=Topomyia yanbarensis TaxID=2498891 RepID=UPI00273ABEF8|nr:nuclear RNA-binding protein sart-3-like [Topomyia yanbarensis]
MRGFDVVRKVYKKAISSVALNDPETLAAAWMRFERCNGSLEQLTACQEICTATVQAYYRTLNQQRTPKGRRSDPKKELEPKEPNKKKPLKRPIDESNSSESNEDHFKKPIVPIGPLPRKKSDSSIEENTKRIRLEAPVVIKEKDTANNSRRLLFFSNLSFDATEDQIRANFPELQFKSIELVQGSSGKSCRFGYVEFEDEQDVQKALSFDRRLLDGRPFSERFEPNKLFIKRLSFEAGNEDVRKLFEPYGKLRDVQVVYYRSGKSKGLAYVEYESEAAAKNAVLNMDQYEMNGFTLTVALSAPPPRGNPTERSGSETTVAGSSLGGGKRHAVKGDVKQKLSIMIPTALLRKATPTNPQAGTSSHGNKPKSIEDFRKLLLK